jgi:hypothetical protein
MFSDVVKVSELRVFSFGIKNTKNGTLGRAAKPVWNTG